jgi:hypothetical protein
MNYQEAKNIRGKGYISHLTDKLSEGQGFGSAIKSTISEKSKARSMGWKEKFDPMNIAKFMTGGSKFAPALLGSMTGRTKQDMQYFAGSPKAKNIDDTATKIGSLESDNKVLDVLLKIYDLMKSTNENDTKRREEENSKKEEIQLEKEKRHKELIEAITGKKTQTATPATAVKENSGGGIMAAIMGMITGLIGDAIGGVMAIIGGITSFIEFLKLSLGGAGKILQLIPRIGAFFISPFGAAFLGVTSLMTLLALDKNPEATNKGIQAAGDIGEANRQMMEVVENTSGVEKRKQNLLAERPSSKKSFLFWKDPELQKKYLVEIGFDEKTGLTEKEKQQGFTGVDDNGKPIKKQTATPENGTSTSSTTPLPVSSESTSKTDATSSLVASEPTAKPAESRQNAGPELMNQIAGSTSKLNTVTKENLDLALPTKPDSVSEAQVTNNTNINKTIATKPKGPIPSVRNLETSFQEMIMYSTRVV